MSIPSELISQFVKVTKDKTKTKSETTVYGTTVLHEGRTYVRLDGSDLLTPVTSTADTKADERVTVRIKNHTATITGNMSSPAARTGDVSEANTKITELDIAVANRVTTEQLDAEIARIDKILADNITTENLSAVNAAIENLTADNAEIKEKLTAAEADIDSLETDKLDAGVAKVTYATIENLDATNADVHDLEADFGNINTLMFGSASGNVIQSSFANAVIAQLGNAQIKSAMIDNVAANKIMSGDIITNNVRVKSEDGSLIISDETMQISDSSRVRVQIGKDASNDYSINIWDADGNLMFSKGGITDNAIKEAIIRNDMVSDTANIAAHKLDIDSLFEEINGSTNTIKSTKIYLDDKKQTLDVAFESLSSTVEDQGETITSQGTAISTIQGQISSKIWQQDINTATGNISTQYSTLSQDLASFKATVGETYATIEDVESVSVGGRNYIVPSKLSTYSEYTAIQSADEDTISIAFKSSYGSSASGSYLTLRVNDYKPPNEIMTLSGYIKVNGVIPESNYFTTRASTYGETEIVSSYDSSTGYFVCTQKYDGSSLWIIHTIVERESNAEDVVTFEKLKFEKGTIPTDWTPAPENIDTRVTAAESSITQLADRITTNVTKTTELGTRVSTFEQTANGLTTRLDTLAIGGRNLLRNSRLVKMFSNNPNAYPTNCVETTENGVTFYRVTRTDIATYPSPTLSIYSTFPKTSFAYGEMAGKQVTLSFKARTSHNITGSFMDFTYGGGTVVDFGKPAETFTTDWKTYHITIDEFPDLSDKTGIRWNPYNFALTSDILADFHLDVCDYKFELGNQPTDWTPAPEDVDADVANAAKTATNYLNFSNSGLVVGDMTANSLGKNVQIASDAVNIRTGDTVNAVFGGDVIELAKDNESATISMLNGAFKIYYDADNSDGGFGVYGVTSDGRERLAFQPVNENDNLTIGWGGYDAGENRTNIYGNGINMFAKNGIALHPGESQFIELSGNTYLPNGRNIFASNTSGDKRSIAIWNTSNQLMYGYGSYVNSEGSVYYDGNTVNIRSKNDVNINGRAYGKNKILWSGGRYMSADHTCTLSEAISAQPHGIVLVFSQYVDGAAANQSFCDHFIPKYAIENHNGKGHCIHMSTSSLSLYATKYLYISDTQITGHDNNVAYGTADCGITYANSNFVLRYVIGV